MSQLFMSRIAVSNFRAFGPNFELSMPPAPGLVIIYGMNGLGKTTFFEALEWLLTGDVRRISGSVRAGQLENHLTRHGAAPYSHFVEAKFDPENRSISRSSTETPSADKIRQLLVSPDWPTPPHDIATYLRLTAFLPQSRKYRFEEEDAKEQWALLRGPAGVDRLEAIRRALGGQATKNAFERVKTKLELKREKSRRLVDEWEQLITRRDALASRVSDDQATSPDQVEETISDIVSRISESTEMIGLPKSEIWSGWRPERKLADLVSHLDARKDRVAEELTSLRTMPDVINEWEETSSALEQEQLAIEDLGSKMTAGNRETHLLQNAVNEANDLAQEAESSLAAINQENLELIKLKDAAVRLEENTALLTSTPQVKNDIDGSITTKMQSLGRLGEIDRKRRELTASIARIESEQRVLVSLGDRHDAFIASNVEANARLAQLDAAKKGATELKRTKLEFQSNCQKQRLHREQLVERRNQAHAGHDAMTQAVAIVCQHIAQDASVCPVCQADYREGELLRRAKRSVESSGLNTSEIDKQIADTDTAIELLVEDIGATEQRLVELPAEIEGLELEISRRRTERTEIERSLNEKGCQWVDAKNGVQKLKQKLEELGKSQRGELSSLPELDVIRAEREELESSLVTLREQLESANREIADLVARIKEDKAILAMYRDRKGLSDLNASDLEVKIEELESHEKQSSTELAKRTNIASLATDALARQKSKLSVIAAKHSKQQSETAANSARQKTLAERWARLLPGSPDRTSLQNAISVREDAVEMIERFRRDCATAAARLDAWNKRSEVVKISEQISNRLAENDGCSEQELKEKLQLDASKLESEIERVEHVSQRAEQLAQELRDRVADFNNRALRPLAGRIQRFHDVLSPFRFKIDMEARTQSSTTRLRQRVSNQSVASPTGANPQVELSDGQMAVQGLSTLFAASTEYQWSRWRALLLDDPLQSSDLLHASAFIDILRALITELDYQVFLSSHDIEEAKYIIRKCERSGINVVKCHLLGPRSGGVRSVIS